MNSNKSDVKYTSFVYFLGAQNLVKIGFSDNLERRLRDLSSGPLKLVLDILVSGNHNVEHDFHNQFRRFRHNGEWFVNRKEIIEEVITDFYTNDKERLLYISEEWNSVIKQFENENHPENILIHKIPSHCSSENETQSITLIQPINNNIPQPGEKPKIIKVKEVAAILRVSRAQVYRLIKSRDLPAKWFGKAVRIQSDDLEKYIREHNSFRSNS